MKILIADDDRLSRLLLCRVLEKAGYEREPADSAETAKEKLQSGEPISAEVPVLICTAQDPTRWYDAADCLGIAEHVAKPLNAQELIERVSQ